MLPTVRLVVAISMAKLISRRCATYSLLRALLIVASEAWYHIIIGYVLLEFQPQRKGAFWHLGALLSPKSCDG